MDQPTGQSQTPGAPRPGHRDMMFCHECHDEWYRDQHGLTCPECGSDFTEIIEENNDPRDDDMFGHGHDDDNESMPSLEEAPPHNHALHQPNPFRSDDPDEDDIGNFQFRQVGPGRFAVTGTMYRTLSPADIGRGGGGGGGNNGPNTVGGFASLLNSIIGGGRAPGQNPGQNQAQSLGDQGAERQGTPGVRSGSGSFGGHRFTYTAGARLYPRDGDHPEPHLEPVDELNNVLVGLMAAFGEPPGHRHHHHPFPEAPDGQAGGPPINPLMHLFTQMMGGSGQVGDAVYSQEALDRIISQLMEQVPTSNAPPPATQNDIDSLPRKTVTVDMLGPEGRAECSICMEEVNIGEEVAELPCHHWFHHACVAAWLGEHDTCPHCRKGITKQSENPANQNQASNNQAASGSSPSMQMPGAYRVAGEGTLNDPLVVSSSPPSNSHGPSNSQSGASSNQDANSGGGLGDRIRRGLFGPPSS